MDTERSPTGKPIKGLTGIELAQTRNYLKASGYIRTLLLNIGANSIEYRCLMM